MPRKKKILIVDDENGFNCVMRLTLEFMGDYEVITENHPTQALQTALKFIPDLIFLDVVMPDSDGTDVYTQLRGNVRLKNTPVIFLTATVTKEEVDEQGGMIGGYPFLAKFGSFNELVNCIEKYVQ